MRYPTVADALETYLRIIKQTGGLIGIRDIGALESAIAQPRMTFNEKTFIRPLSRRHRRWDSHS
jgi:hypothetical protein